MARVPRLPLALALLVGCTTGCANSGSLSSGSGSGEITSIATPMAPATSAGGGQAVVRPLQFRLQVGDEIAVAVWKEPELSTQQRVGPDGTISPLLLGTVPVVGATVEETRARLTEAYREYLKSPVVSVRVVTIYSDRVFVLGEVKTPSAIPLVGPATAVQGITLAGGFLEEFAEKSEVRLVRAGPGGQPQVMTIRADLVLAGRMADVPLQRGDIVYVPARGVTNWSRTLGQALSPIADAISTAGGAAALIDLAR